MHHVGIAQHHVCASTNGAARVLRCITVIGEDTDVAATLHSQQLRKLMQLRELVLRERLGREQIQRTCGRVAEDRVHYRGVVTEGLARRGRRDGHHIAAGRRVRNCFRLMGVQLIDPTLAQGRNETRIQMFRKWRIPRLHGIQAPHRRHMRIVIIDLHGLLVLREHAGECEREGFVLAAGIDQCRQHGHGESTPFG